MQCYEMKNEGPFVEDMIIVIDLRKILYAGQLVYHPNG
jgi:hypothetical protein